LSISTNTKDYIARLIAGGIEPAKIAILTGVGAQTIAKYGKDHDEDMSRRIALYRSNLMRGVAFHSFEMMDMLQAARDVVREGLSASPGSLPYRERFEAAKYAISQVMAGPSQNVNLNVNGEIGHKVSGEVQAALLKVSAKLEELSASDALRLASGRIKEGPGALPGPAVQITAKAGNGSTEVEEESEQ
jgi:hypothetical protein